MSCQPVNISGQENAAEPLKRLLDTLLNPLLVAMGVVVLARNRDKRPSEIQGLLPMVLHLRLVQSVLLTAAN